MNDTLMNHYFSITPLTPEGYASSKDLEGLLIQQNYFVGVEFDDDLAVNYFDPYPSPTPSYFPSLPIFSEHHNASGEDPLFVAISSGNETVEMVVWQLENKPASSTVFPRCP